MRALVQRVTHGAVRVGDKIVWEIGRGLVVFIGVTGMDGDADVEFLATKVANLRIFDDEAGRANLSGLETGAEILVVSQFTLYADTRRGRRPDYLQAAPPEQAEPLVEAFAARLEALGLHVARGRFGARMMVEISNDGPVTIWLDSRDK